MQHWKRVGFAAVAIGIVLAVYFMLVPTPAVLDKPLTLEQAQARLPEMVERIQWSSRPVQRRAKLQLGSHKDLKETLPAIEQFELTVDPAVGPDDLLVEIFVTTTRAGKDTDGHMVDVAKAFNDANVALSGGKTAKIRIRRIESGTGYEYIASRKYLPDAFSPVHSLWIEMAKANGVAMTEIRPSMARSVAGIVMKSRTAERIREKYHVVDVRSIINEVVQGGIAMGYTNPFASSTGLNFLVTVLDTFAEGGLDPLSPAVVSTFEKFQQGVPFVALSTLHMRDSVRNDGSLDAFIMGHQTFLKTAELQHGYEFIPFGFPHTHPFYAVGDPGTQKMEALEQFARFAERPEFRRLAERYGWNQPISTSYQPDLVMPDGAMLLQMQRLWKEKKDAGRPIAAIFIADVSGSMAGSRIRALKQALLSGSEFISPENHIGLATFSNTVTELLPVNRFNLNQKAAFHAAVQDMDTGGNTAMYDGVLVSLKLLLDYKGAHPEVKPMLFVLTDGQTNEGFTLSDAEEVIQALKVPVYTIGYEADLKVLKELSSLVEAASINAGEGDVEYKIGSLLNAQM